MGLSNTKPFITPAHLLALDDVDQHTKVNGVLLKKIKKWFQRKGKGEKGRNKLHLVNCGLPAADLAFAKTFCKSIDDQLEDTHAASLACLRRIDVINVPATSSCCARLYGIGSVGCTRICLFIAACCIFAFICFLLQIGRITTWSTTTAVNYGVVKWVRITFEYGLYAAAVYVTYYFGSLGCRS